jgi:DNA-binding transcriptional MerR regulator
LEQLSLFSSDVSETDTPEQKIMGIKPIRRLYYSIAEVSRITGLKAYVLRFWESEFSELRPSKNNAGNRIYRKSDIRNIFLIKRLLYQEKYTIDGAKQYLRRMRARDDPKLQMSLMELKRDDLIEEIKAGLRELIVILENNKSDRGVAQSG